MDYIVGGIIGLLVGWLFFPMPAFIRAKFEEWGVVKPLLPKL